MTRPTSKAKPIEGSNQRGGKAKLDGKLNCKPIASATAMLTAHRGSPFVRRRHAGTRRVSTSPRARPGSCNNRSTLRNWPRSACTVDSNGPLAGDGSTSGGSSGCSGGQATHHGRAKLRANRGLGPSCGQCSAAHRRAYSIAVFFSFVLGDIRVLELLGLGLSTAVLVDATIVRMVLVPATMELLGDANWWLPRVLQRRLPHFEVERELVSSN